MAAQHSTVQFSTAQHGSSVLQHDRVYHICDSLLENGMRDAACFTPTALAYGLMVRPYACECLLINLQRICELEI